MDYWNQHYFESGGILKGVVYYAASMVVVPVLAILYLLPFFLLVGLVGYLLGF